MNPYTFYVYLTTNPEKTVLYTGMTNDLIRRMDEHHQARGKSNTFAGRYQCYNLIYWEFPRMFTLPSVTRRKSKVGNAKRK